MPELEIEASISLLSNKMDGMGKKLEAWAYSFFHDMGTIPGVGVTGQSLIFNLGGPPPGYMYKVRAVQATGPNVTAIASVVMDIYVASQGTPSPGNSAPSTNVPVPSIGAWWASNSISSAPSSLPAAYFPGSDEMWLNSGDNLLVVLSGAGITTGLQCYVGAYAEQMEGFSGFRRQSR